MDSSFDTIISLSKQKKDVEKKIEVESKLKHIMRLTEKHDTASKDLEGISVSLLNLEHDTEGLRALENDLENKKEKLTKLLLDAKICPICGSETSKEKIEVSL